MMAGTGEKKHALPGKINLPFKGRVGPQETGDRRGGERGGEGEHQKKGLKKMGLVSRREKEKSGGGG